MRKAKIVCTIGPSSRSEDVVKRLLKAGMNVARLNFSHGTHEEHRRVVETIREQSAKLNIPVAILQDLGGIKIRVGPLKAGSITLKKGACLKIDPKELEGDEERISVSYPRIVKDTSEGERILLDDGLLQLEVVGKEKGCLVTKVIEGGVLKERKGVNLPGTKISAPALTEKDERDLAFGVELGVDYMAISFVRSKEDVKKVKTLQRKQGAHIPVIAKIEKPEALEEIDGIMDVSDGIMIARGDLGVELCPERVPLLQKELIEKANRKMKMVITATQMLESMTTHMRPTRAETADVANAVLDGTDGLMLSGETAAGKYPVRALKMMDRIIRYTEKHRSDGHSIRPPATNFPEATVEAACTAAEKVRAKALIAFTQSGHTALIASKFRPPVPIIAYTVSEEIVRKTNLFWGVFSGTMKPLQDTDEMVFELERVLLSEGLVKKGDPIVIIASSPLSLRGKTNLMKLHRIGS